MKIYDISHEMFTAKVYPGDPIPQHSPVLSIAEGAVCNLTRLELGSHNGSHMDAPRHFYEDGRTIDQLDLDKCIGECTLIEHHGMVTHREIETIAAFSKKRLLIKGDITLTVDAAKALVGYGFLFLGVEGLTVGAEKIPAEHLIPSIATTAERIADLQKSCMPPAVHRVLLAPEADMVIAENLNLADIPVGEYFLVSVPLKLGGLDGAPCRPILLQFEE